MAPIQTHSALIADTTGNDLGNVFDLAAVTRPIDSPVLDRTTDNGCDTQPACAYPAPAL